MYGRAVLFMNQSVCICAYIFFQSRKSRKIRDGKVFC